MVQSKVIEKKYRIGELAGMAGVTVRTIRYYEELGILESQERGESEHRRYTGRDLLHLQRVQQLKSYDLTLNEIREIFDLSMEDPTGEKSRLKLLSRYKQKHEEALSRKKNLEKYISELEWHVDQLESVGDFQSCPGEECRGCDYTEICKFYNAGK
jgi:DNA-binding transcriptional MerR regulator